jgi:hypothetical protein
VARVDLGSEHLGELGGGGLGLQPHQALAMLSGFCALGSVDRV